jgi:hypothetical protein
MDGVSEPAKVNVDLVLCGALVCNAGKATPSS